jgi:hypothetical protein
VGDKTTQLDLESSIRHKIAFLKIGKWHAFANNKKIRRIPYYQAVIGLLDIKVNRH